MTVFLQFIIGLFPCLLCYLYYLLFRKYWMAKLVIYGVLPVYVCLFALRLNM